MKRRPAEMLRRALPNDEAELRPAGPEVVVRGEEEKVGIKLSTVEHDSSMLSARVVMLMIMRDFMTILLLREGEGLG
jgi:hypothetical protein